MFDYARNMQLALSDIGRRAGLTAAAGALLLVGLGFLLAALWTYLAHHLGWGSLYASLAIGGVFFVIGLIILAAGGRKRHAIPSTDDLQAEVEQRLGDATDKVIGKVRDRADEVVETARAKATAVVSDAESRVHGLVDDVTYRLDSFADAAETRIGGVARNTAQAVGITPEMVQGATEAARDGLDRFKQSRAAPAVGVAGALALGLAAANTLSGLLRRDHDDASWEDDDYYDDYDEDYDDEYYRR